MVCISGLAGRVARAAVEGPGAAPGRGRCHAVLVVLLALLLLPACQSTEPLGRIILPNQVNPWDPPVNPDPRHVVRLHGRAPATLDFLFSIGFMTTNQEGDCYKHLGFWEGGGAKGWEYELHPVRNGDEWVADWVVDRYLPGRCGWNIKGNAMLMVTPLEVREGDSAGPVMRLVVADARALDENAPRCEPRNPRCTEERSRLLANTDDAIPVQVRCTRDGGKVRGPGERVIICDRFPEHKITHGLKAHTQKIRIDLYDLDHEEVP
ncbi:MULTISPECIES: hypothetical protein [unclassified Luteimonas]